MTPWAGSGDVTLPLLSSCTVRVHPIDSHRRLWSPQPGTGARPCKTLTWLLAALVFDSGSGPVVRRRHGLHQSRRAMGVEDVRNRHRAAEADRGPGPRRSAVPRAPSLPAPYRHQERRQRGRRRGSGAGRLSPSISDYDPASGAPPLAWVTLATKRRCWRLRDAAHLDRRVFALPQTGHEEPTGLIERRPADPTPPCERHVDRAEALARLADLKPDERRTLVLLAAGYTYREVGAITGWTYTKVNRCASEGRAALRAAAASA